MFTIVSSNSNFQPHRNTGSLLAASRSVQIIILQTVRVSQFSPATVSAAICSAGSSSRQWNENHEWNSCRITVRAAPGWRLAGRAGKTVHCTGCRDSRPWHTRHRHQHHQPTFTCVLALAGLGWAGLAGLGEAKHQECSNHPLPAPASCCPRCATTRAGNEGPQSFKLFKLR